MTRITTTSQRKRLANNIQANATKFLKEYNDLSLLHHDLIDELIANYTYQLFQEGAPTRQVWAAHPGLGKTTCLRFFLLEVIRSIRSGELDPLTLSGILVCSNQVTELEDHIIFLQEQLGDSAADVLGLYHTKPNSRDFTARVGISTINQLKKLPIIFATQNLIRRKGSDLHQSKGQAQERLEEICFYKDEVRFLCWDEEAIATRACHANISYLKEFRRRATNAAKYSKLLTPLVDVIKKVIRQVEDSTIQRVKSFNVRVPSLEVEQILPIEMYLRSQSATKELGQNYIKHALQVLKWQGETAVVHNSKEGDGTVMDFVIELPDALERAVITDASAATNKLIKLDSTMTLASFIQEHGSRLKQYDNLSLFIKPTPAGRSSFIQADHIDDSWYEIIRYAVALLPAADSLVITFKGSDARPDAHIREIKEILSEEDLGRFRFTTWGKHRGSNQWKDCQNVFLFGTLHLDEAMLSSLARAQTRNPLEDDLQPYSTRELIHSQTASDIQQALSRGSCREVSTIDGVTQANPMNAFLALSKRELPYVVGHLRSCFPGIQIFDVDTQALMQEEKYLSLSEKVSGCIQEYLSVAKTDSVKTKDIKAWIEDHLDIVIDKSLWSRAKENAHTPGWIRKGQSYARQAAVVESLEISLSL